MDLTLAKYFIKFNYDFSEISCKLTNVNGTIQGN